MSQETRHDRSAPRPIRILTADDHPLVRDGIAALVSGHEDIALVGEAGTGVEALEKVRALRPDIVLMDIQMPGMNGIDAIGEIRREYPATRLIVLTTYGGDDLARRAMRAGAHAYMLKTSVRKDLLSTIRAVHGGRTLVHPEVAGNVAAQLGSESPTERELAVLRLIASGHSNKRIADRLGISEDTVKGHVKNLLAKLQANDRTHAVTLALRRGMIDLD